MAPEAFRLWKIRIAPGTPRTPAPAEGGGRPLRLKHRRGDRLGVEPGGAVARLGWGRQDGSGPDRQPYRGDVCAMHEAARDRLLALYAPLRVADVRDGMDWVMLHGRGDVAPEIRPLWRTRFCGFARTARCAAPGRGARGGGPGSRGPGT